MSRKLCLERLETRDTPSAGLGGDGPSIVLPSLPPVGTPVQVAPINIVNLSATGTTVAIGISLADPTLMPPGGSPSNAPPVSTPLQPYQFYFYDPTHYAYLITPV